MYRTTERNGLMPAKKREWTLIMSKKNSGVLKDFSNTGDDRKLWRVIKSLNATPEKNSPMIHNDQCIT